MKIGSVQLKNNVLAAPMAGVTDKAFRILAREAGCGMVYTEMVSAKALTYGNRKTSEILDLSGEPSPLAVQIFGSDPQVVAEGADIAVKAGADIVDINMGCPAPKIVRNGEGAALMLDMDLALEVAGAVVERVDVPVTVKMRKGWDQQSVNSVEMSVGMEGVGVSGITVHGRTRDQFYAGRADWDIIKEVKRAVGIPVIGNGDIWKPQDARDMLEYTQCDGIMVGRGAMGNPWLFEQILSYIRDGSLLPEPTPKERILLAGRHLRLAVKFKGEKKGVMEMRKHLAWYLKGFPGASGWRNKINQTDSLEAVEELLGEILQVTA